MPRMTLLSQNVPVSLYIHTPWCVKKCPYCDFNSHSLRGNIPTKAYVKTVLADLTLDAQTLQQRPIHSIFIGGGTPSLLNPSDYEDLLSGIDQRIGLPKDIEITLEANPGTVEQSRFEGFRAAGINRLSLGIQSFQDKKLKALGRIHGAKEAMRAIEITQQAGFDNFNLDLMFGLPDQSIEEALLDLKTALIFAPTHLSWYQLTIEPNTYFYQHRPKLPNDDHSWEMQQQGQALLANAGFNQYEISAYSQPNKQCQHNLNYWLFGDYLGIGAGAHSKITHFDTQTITRQWKHRHPNQYLQSTDNFNAGSKTATKNELLLEFMMNALRLEQPIPIELLSQRTGLGFNDCESILEQAIKKELLIINENSFQKTSLGKHFLNDLLEIFI